MANEATIDELQIEISTTSASAAENLEKLAQKLERLEAATSRITGGNDGLNKVAKQIDKLNAISQKIQSMQGFEKLGRAVEQLKKLNELNNIGDISGAIRNLNKLPQAMNAIAQMPSVDAAKFQQLADALKPLETVSTGNINSMLNSLRKLPKISQELAGMDFSAFSRQIEQIARAVEPLARQAQSAGTGLTALAQIMQQTNRQARQSSDGVSLFNRAIGDIKVKTLAAIAGLRRLFSALKSGVTASAAYVENLNLFSVTMGDSADEALRFAESVNAALGVDTSDWIRYQGVFQSIGKGFGIASDQADLMSKNLTQLSHDIASFYNLSVETAAEKLQSAMTGQTEPMRALGFAIEETTLKQVALNHGITTSVEKMTQAQKAQLRYIAIMEQAGNIGVLGDMARTIDTASNGMRVLEARIQQFSRAVGNMFMPILSAALPYLTAFVQVLTEGAQAIANFFGFELPKIDFSDAQVSSGFDDITGAIDEATEASEKFKGSLSSIDQLNIIGSENENKLAAADNQFDLGINLPEYDFLQGVESKTKQIADNIKDWFKEALPWIEAVGAGITAAFAASKVSGFISAVGNLYDGMKKFIGLDATKTFMGIAGGLVAGATSGVLMYDSVKKLITGTGNFSMNIAKIVASVGILAAAFAFLNPVGAALASIGFIIGGVAGAIAGANEEVAKQNAIIERNMLFMQGTSTITEIADAFSDWAGKAKQVNDQIINQYAELENDRLKVDELYESVKAVAGIKIDFSNFTSADAAALKGPFDELATYLKGDFENTAKTVVQDLEGIFAGANIAQPLINQMTQGYQKMIDLFGSNIDKAQSTIDEYLDKIAANGSLTAVEQADFQRNYQLIMETANTEDSKNLDYALKQFNELDLSKIDFENNATAQEMLQNILTEAEAYERSITDRLSEEEKNLMVMFKDLETQYQLGFIDQSQYDQSFALLSQSEDIFRANAARQLDDLADKILTVQDAVDLQVRNAAKEMSPDVGDYNLAIGSRGWLVSLFDIEGTKKLSQDIAASKYLEGSDIFAGSQELLAEVHNLRDSELILKSKISSDNPIAQKILDTGEAEANIKAKIGLEVAETDMNKVNDAVKKTFETEMGMDWSKFNPPLADTSESAKVGFAREAYSQATRQNAPEFGGADGMEANVTVYNYLEMDGEIVAEKVNDINTRLAYRNNGR